jgi:CubicO group peptidase (beta-lactamase class C family)
MDVQRIWTVLDGLMEAGRFPGYVAAVRVQGHTEVRAGGATAVERGSPPMRPDTLFRLASLTKPIGGALTLSLVQDGVLGLDDPVARWLPEAASPTVLRAADAPLDQTTEAVRPVTVRHLLTFTAGWGAMLEHTPLQRAMLERGVFSSALTPQMTADDYVARVAGLPLAFQPGEGWLYDTPMDLLGVLLVRATGRPLAELLAERVFGPLGMTDTGYWARDAGRLAAFYRPGAAARPARPAPAEPELVAHGPRPVARGLELVDPPDGLFARPPAFEELRSGLVGTAGDVLRFFCAMADGGGPLLSPDMAARMTADALTGEQRRQAAPVVGPGASWGLGTSVDVEPVAPYMAPGRWGWTGGAGTSAFVDPRRGTVGVLLTQREMTSPLDRNDAFWTALAAAA